MSRPDDVAASFRDEWNRKMQIKPGDGPLVREIKAIGAKAGAHTSSRTGAREAEGSGLLSRPTGDRRVGSNPTPSASEPGGFSGASGQREVGPTGNEGRRSGSEHPAAKRYVVDTIIGPCEQWEAEDLAEAIMQLRQFSNVGGGAVSLTVFEEDE